jgi:dTDP-4-amino-4,6-dideoxygalactose transaminase
MNESEWDIPLSDIDYGIEEENAVLRILQGRWLSSGPEVTAFENEFAAFVGARHAIAVSNGTGALQLALHILGITKGHKIIQPAINFVAAANMTLAADLMPVFSDIINLQEPTIDPAGIEQVISQDTKAIIVMHYGGFPCRMAEISDLCNKYGLYLIEDACHGIGARFTDGRQRVPDSRMVGNLSDIACFSFFSNKNLSTGEGGMITTNSDDLASRARLMRSHGMTAMTWDRHRGYASSYDVVCHGFNYRFDELRAALGRVQLKKLEKNNLRRRDLFNSYCKNLAHLQDWIIPFTDYEGESAYHLMAIVPPDKAMRAKVVAALKDNRIQSSLHYPYIPGFTAFSHNKQEPLEKSISFSERVITLPLYPTLTTHEVDKICSIISASV